MSEVEYNYTIEDVAKKFSVTAETVRRWCREEKIKYFKWPGKKGGYRFSGEDLRDFVASENSKPVEEVQK